MVSRHLFSRVRALTSPLHDIKPRCSAFRMLSAGRELTVEHDRRNLRFTVGLHGASVERDCACAVLRYRFTGEREVDLLSTHVPEAFRGQGVAALLSKAALDFVVEEKLRARVSCWYIKKYVEENPVRVYKDHIVSYSEDHSQLTQ